MIRKLKRIRQALCPHREQHLTVTQRRHVWTCKRCGATSQGHSLTARLGKL